MSTRRYFNTDCSFLVFSSLAILLPFCHSRKKITERNIYVKHICTFDYDLFSALTTLRYLSDTIAIRIVWGHGALVVQWLTFCCARRSSQPRQRKANSPPIFSGAGMLNLMKQTCREMTSSVRRRQLAVTELLRHARIVTDPKTLAYLDAEVAKRKGGAEGATSEQNPRRHGRARRSVRMDRFGLNPAT